MEVVLWVKAQIRASPAYDYNDKSLSLKEVQEGG